MHLSPRLILAIVCLLISSELFAERIRNTWNGLYTHSSGDYPGALAQGIPLYESWVSQQWIFEKMPNRNNDYRIKNRRDQRYLSSCDDSEWSELCLEDLIPGRRAQQWSITPVDIRGYRLQNLKTGFYMHTLDEQRETIRQSALNEGWAAQIYAFDGDGQAPTFNIPGGARTNPVGVMLGGNSTEFEAEVEKMDVSHVRTGIWNFDLTQNPLSEATIDVRDNFDWLIRENQFKVYVTFNTSSPGQEKRFRSAVDSLLQRYTSEELENIIYISFGNEVSNGIPNKELEENPDAYGAYIQRYEAFYDYIKSNPSLRHAKIGLSINTPRNNQFRNNITTLFTAFSQRGKTDIVEMIDIHNHWRWHPVVTSGVPSEYKTPLEYSAEYLYITLLDAGFSEAQIENIAKLSGETTTYAGQFNEAPFQGEEEQAVSEFAMIIDGLTAEEQSQPAYDVIYRGRIADRPEPNENDEIFNWNGMLFDGEDRNYQGDIGYLNGLGDDKPKMAAVNLKLVSQLLHNSQNITLHKREDDVAQYRIGYTGEGNEMFYPGGHIRPRVYIYNNTRANMTELRSNYILADALARGATGTIIEAIPQMTSGENAIGTPENRTAYLDLIESIPQYYQKTRFTVGDNKILSHTLKNNVPIIVVFDDNGTNVTQQ